MMMRTNQSHLEAHSCFLSSVADGWRICRWGTFSKIWVHANHWKRTWTCPPLPPAWHSDNSQVPTDDHYTAANRHHPSHETHPHHASSSVQFPLENFQRFPADMHQGCFLPLLNRRFSSPKDQLQVPGGLLLCWTHSLSWLFLEHILQHFFFDKWSYFVSIKRY